MTDAQSIRPSRGLTPWVLAGLWLVVIYRMGALWLAHPDYNYGWMVPCLCLAALWERVGRCPAPQPARPGLALAWILGLAALLVPTRLALEVLPIWRLASWALALEAVGITLGIVYYMGGRPWLRHFFFPAAFFLVAVPWPTAFEEPFIQKLSRLNAAWAVQVLTVFDVAAVARGNLIEIASGTLGVDEACSGIRSFQGTVMAALFLGELARFGLPRRVLLLGAGVALSFLFNVVRTSLLTWSCEKHGMAALGQWHDPAGLGILGVTLVCLLGLVWALRWIAPPHSDKPAGPGAAPKPSPALPPLAALLGVALVLAGVEAGLAGWFAAKERGLAAAPVWEVRWPGAAEGGKPLTIAPNAREILACDEGSGAEWSEPGGLRWQAFYFRWRPSESLYRRVKASAHAKGHSPDLCLSSSGMTLKKDLGEQLVQAKAGAFVFHGYQFEDRGRPLWVYAMAWERGKDRAARESTAVQASSLHALRQVGTDFTAGDRDGSLEQRVLKFGLWGAPDEDQARKALLRNLDQILAPAR